MNYSLLPDAQGIEQSTKNLIIDHESVRLILKELDSLGAQQGVRHRLTRRNYISTNPNHAWHIDGYDKLKPLRFGSHVAIDGHSRKILWFFVG